MPSLPEGGVWFFAVRDSDVEKLPKGIRALVEEQFDAVNIFGVPVRKLLVIEHFGVIVKKASDSPEERYREGLEPDERQSRMGSCPLIDWLLKHPEFVFVG